MTGVRRGPVAEGPCPFCEIVAGRAPAEWIVQPDYWPDAVAFIPLNPVVEGHCLVVPKVHVADFASVPAVFAATAQRAAELMRWTPRPMNVITSRGRPATQTVFHLHLHLVPRTEGDGLALPWTAESTGQEQTQMGAAIDTVLGWHQPDPYGRAGHLPDSDRTPVAYGRIAQACQECGSEDLAVRWPCRTYRALNTVGTRLAPHAATVTPSAAPGAPNARPDDARPAEDDQRRADGRTACGRASS